MKKQTKKLVLAKETVRDLNAAGLEQVQGGTGGSTTTIGGTNVTYSAGGGCIVTQRCTSDPNNETS